jgi:hypothetical protein
MRVMSCASICGNIWSRRVSMTDFVTGLSDMAATVQKGSKTG